MALFVLFFTICSGAFVGVICQCCLQAPALQRNHTDYFKSSFSQSIVPTLVQMFHIACALALSIMCIYSQSTWDYIFKPCAENWHTLCSHIVALSHFHTSNGFASVIVMSKVICKIDR
jgi:hypothetical protein